MTIRAILARDEAWGIGREGGLPWPHNPLDLRWFKECTLGGTVIMGRKTWDSLPKQPLPGRRNVVVTSAGGQWEVETITADFPEHIISSTVFSPREDQWVIGGGQLIESWLPHIKEIWLSVIPGIYDCDVFLPRDQILDEYEQTERYHYLGKDLVIEKYRRRA